MPDAILYWNDVANEANKEAHTSDPPPPQEAEARGPCGSSRTYAIVHLAMHDAYFSLNPTSEHGTYLDNLPVAPPNASTDAAIAGAAHATLTALYPTQTALFDGKLAALGLTGPAAVAGDTQGRAIAALLLARRAADPTVGAAGHTTSDAPGRHRLDPDNPDQKFHGPLYGGAICFAVHKRHDLKPPPGLDDDGYEDALRDVRAKGIAPALMGTLDEDDDRRTPEETLIGIYWAYDGAKGLGTPPRFYNQIVREIVEARRAAGDSGDAAHRLKENARLFALVNAAIGDAGILAWQEKYKHDFWRPVLAIREDGASMGPEGTGQDDFEDLADPGWLPLGAAATNSFATPAQPLAKKNFTPNFPAYPSGHATFGAAALDTVRRYYKAKNVEIDDLVQEIDFVSEELNGVNRDNNGTVRPRHARRFEDGLQEMIRENARSRIFLGVHWQFDGFLLDDDDDDELVDRIGGVPLGLAIAKDIATNGLTASAGAPPEL